MKIPTDIRCAICQRLVDSIEMMPPFGSCRSYKLTVSCHGDTETVQLTLEDLADAVTIQAGEAFATKRIDP